MYTEKRQALRKALNVHRTPIHSSKDTKSFQQKKWEIKNDPRRKDKMITPKDGKGRVIIYPCKNGDPKVNNNCKVDGVACRYFAHTTASSFYGIKLFDYCFTLTSIAAFHASRAKEYDKVNYKFHSAYYNIFSIYKLFINVIYPIAEIIEKGEECSLMISAPGNEKSGMHRLSFSIKRNILGCYIIKIHDPNITLGFYYRALCAERDGIKCLRLDYFIKTSMVRHYFGSLSTGLLWSPQVNNNPQNEASHIEVTKCASRKVQLFYALRHGQVDLVESICSELLKDSEKSWSIAHEDLISISKPDKWDYPGAIEAIRGGFFLRSKEAVKVYCKLVEKAIKDGHQVKYFSKIYIVLGYYAAKLENNLALEVEYIKKINNNRDITHAYYMMGRHYEINNYKDRALIFYKKALKGRHELTLFSLARLCLSKGDEKNAIIYYEKLINVHQCQYSRTKKDRIIARAELTKLYRKHGDVKNASHHGNIYMRNCTPLFPINFAC